VSRTWRRCVRNLELAERGRAFTEIAERLYRAAVDDDDMEAAELLLSSASTGGSMKARELRRLAFGMAEVEDPDALERRVDRWLAEHSA